MRTYLANTLFAGVSLAMTAGIVAFSSAPASAAIPSGDAPRAIVRYSDLDLSTPAGRANLDARIHAAASRVCDSNAGGPDFAGIACRSKVMMQAHRDVAEKLATRSASTTQNAAL